MYSSNRETERRIGKGKKEKMVGGKGMRKKKGGEWNLGPNLHHRLMLLLYGYDSVHSKYFFIILSPF